MKHLTWILKNARPLLPCLLLAGGLPGCSGEGLSGEYRDPRGVTGYTFEPDGRVFISVMGTKTAATYRVEDDHVLIDGTEGVVVLMRKDKELEGPLGLRLIRVP